MYFDESDKGLVLNQVNGNMIEKICGDSETNEWSGKRVVLYATETEFRGQQVACIRVRAPKPGAVIPEKPKEEDLPF